MLGAIAGGVLVGLLSDRIGRRTSIVLALAGGVLVTPLWAYAPQMGLLVSGAFLMQFFVQGAWGVIPAHLSELAPNQVRGFLPGFSYQCGVLLAGSVGWLEARLAEHMRYSTAMALTAVVAMAIAGTMAAVGGEKHALNFEESQ
jgi:SHS family lactate transporter-like MFS transporter